MNKLILPLVLIILVSGCIKQSGEGIFLKASIAPANYDWSDAKLQQYGFIQNEKFSLEFTATKYLSKTDGLMTIDVQLPEAVRPLSGETHWQGNDVSKTISIEAEAEKKGKYEIEVTATNTANDYTASNKITVCIGEDLEEIKTYCTGEISPPPLPA